MCLLDAPATADKLTTHLVKLSVSSLIAIDHYIKQIICLSSGSMYEYVDWLFGCSNGCSSSCSSFCLSSWVLAIFQAIDLTNICTCLHWLIYVYNFVWLSYYLSSSCFVRPNLRPSALVSSLAAWAKCSILSTYICM